MRLSQKKVVVISRCAWTLFNFRCSLIKSILEHGGEVVALGASDAYEEKLRNAGIAFRAIPVAKRSLSPVADLRLIVRLIRELRRERRDVVHCFTIKPAIYGSIAAWLCGVPARVVTITALGYAFTSAGGWLNRLVRMLYKVGLAGAHRVYFQNSVDQAFFQSRRLVAASKARLCAGSGVDLARFAPSVLPVSRGFAPRFLMIARLIREKGVADFVAGAREVKQLHPSSTFAVLGGEDPRNPSALGLSGRSSWSLIRSTS